MVTKSEVGTEPIDYCRVGLNLLERLGVEQLTSALGIRADEFQLMLLGEMPFPEEVCEGLARMDNILMSGRRAVRLNREVATEIEEASVPVPTEEQLEVLPEQGGSVGGFGGYLQVMDVLKADLYAARLMATKNLMDLRLKEEDILTNQLIVLEIELTLILHFNDSVPAPGLAWTEVQCHEEAEKRLRRLRWVNSALAKHDRGIRGVFRRFIHGKRRSPREMLNEMMVEADTVHRLGTAGAESLDELMKRVLEPAGLDADVVRKLMDE